jgi:hypothetical protein
MRSRRETRSRRVVYSESRLALRSSLAKPLLTHTTTRTAPQPKRKHAPDTSTNTAQSVHSISVKWMAPLRASCKKNINHGKTQAPPTARLSRRTPSERAFRLRGNFRPPGPARGHSDQTGPRECMRVAARNLSRSRRQVGSLPKPWARRIATSYRSRIGIRDGSPLLGRSYGQILLSILDIVVS